MAAERNNGKTGTLVLLLGWALLLLGLGALSAWLLTRPLTPLSYHVDRQAYEVVLPDKSLTEAPLDPQKGKDQPEARTETEAESDLTRPPALRGENQGGLGGEETPLIAQPETTTDPPDTDILIESPPPEAFSSEPDEGEGSDVPNPPNEVSAPEGMPEPEDTKSDSEARNRRQPAFAPPQPSPGLPPPAIPGRTTIEKNSMPAEDGPENGENTSPDENEKASTDNRATDDASAETVQQAALSDPDARRLEESAESTLRSGIPAWQRYAQPFTPRQERPLVAIVVSGLGLSEAATETAIRQLPAEIALSFSPYARRLDEWIALARSQGHEVLLDLPMEPENFPADDPGPQALLTELAPQENAARLQWVLGRGSAYVGVAAAEGGGFTASRGALEPLFERLAQEGLVFLGNPAKGNVEMREVARLTDMPLLLSDHLLDREAASRSVINAGLTALERTAVAEGQAVAVARPYPVSLERLQAWSDQLNERGLQLAPPSALMRQ